MNKLIGITGKMGAGKTTLSLYLKEILKCELINVDEFRHDLLKNNIDYINELKHAIKELNEYEIITPEILNKYIYESDEYMTSYKEILYKYLINYINSFNNKTIIIDWALILKDKLENLFDKIIYLDIDEEIRHQRFSINDLKIEEIKRRDLLQETPIPENVLVIKDNNDIEIILNYINDIGCRFTLSNQAKAIFEITHKCNYHCSYCIFSCNGTNIENELTYDECIHIIDELVKNGFKELKITGGEPFIRKDLIDILKYASKYLLTDVSTNASLINEEIVKKLNEIKLKMIHVSLDGDKLTHETLRGTSTYDRTIKGLRCLKESINKVRIGTVISSLNESNIEGIIEDAIDLSADEIILSIMEPPQDKSLEYYKTKTLKELQEEILKLREIYKQDIIVNANFLDNKNNTSYCPGGTNFIYINNFGFISPCPWVYESCGLLSKNSLRNNSLDTLLKEDHMQEFMEAKKRGKCYARIR